MGMNSKGDSGYRQDLYLINNSERIIIERLPGPLEQFSAASPAAKTVIILFAIVAAIVIGFMDYFNLHFGGAASEQQLAFGRMAAETDKTGPQIDYWTESFNIIQSEAARRDNRVRSVDVKQIATPERYERWYGSVVDKRNGYIGNGRFQWFFNYLLPIGGGKYETVCGYGIARLQQKQFGVFVQQKWIVEEYRITYRN